MDSRYKRLETLFLSLLGIQIVVSITSIIFTPDDMNLSLPNVLIYVKIFIMAEIFLTVFYGNYYYKSKMKLARQESHTDNKHQLYFLAYSVRLMLLTICNIFNVLAFVITSNEIYIIVAVPLLFLFFIYKPDKKLYEKLSAADTL